MLKHYGIGKNRIMGNDAFETSRNCIGSESRTAEKHFDGAFALSCSRNKKLLCE